MSKRVRLDPKAKSKSKSMTSTPSSRSMLFDEPQLLAGEDTAAYDELLIRFCTAVKPIDIIDEMLISDAVFLEWEVLRWRRLKSSLIQASQLAALENFVIKRLDYDLYSEHFRSRLAEILQNNNLPEDQIEDLAHRCSLNEPGAVDEVNKFLGRINLRLDKILNDAQTQKAKELVQEYVRREPDAVTLVDEFLTGGGVSLDRLTAVALTGQLDDIDRFDRLTMIAEDRRNAMLREIDRRRAVLGETLRRSVQEVEDAEFKVIETPLAKGKTAA